MLIGALGRYKLLFEIILIGTLAAGALYAVHQFLEHERDIGRGEVQKLWDAQIAKDKESARLETERLAKQAADAEKNGNAREQTIRTLAAATGDASNRLRDTANTISSRMSSISGDALRAVAGAYGDVFTECQTRRGSLAEEIERINSEKRTLIEAWPKPTAKID